MKTILFGILSLLVCSAQAEFIDSDDLIGTAEDVIIDNSYVDTVRHEEPSFADRKVEREIANLHTNKTSSEFEWQGQLVVLKEIPYSYPQLSRRTLQLRALNEFEEEEAQKNNDQ